VQLFLCAVACASCVVASILIGAVGALLTGVGGLAVHAAGLGTRQRWSPSRYAVLAAVGALALVGVGLPVWVLLRPLPAFNTTTMDAEAVRPFVAAMNEVDRASLGFSEIPPDATVQTEYATLTALGYDVMLHVYADTSRTISFERDDGSYKWIGEQEIYTGPGEYESADGLFDEQISITYNTVETFGAPLPLNTVHVHYVGDDPRLWSKSNLTLEDVAPILEEWRALRTPTPVSLP
jgi:hypothetical protein